MPRKNARSKKRTKRKKRKRPYKRDKRAHKVRRRKLHHKAEFRKEQEMTNYLLHQMLKTMSAPEGQYDYHSLHQGPRVQVLERPHENVQAGLPEPGRQLLAPPRPPRVGYLDRGALQGQHTPIG